MNDYYAHSENANNERHLLSKHLQSTALLMEKIACLAEYKMMFKMTGLLHDLGKYQSAFQQYLINGGRRGSVPHASWGAGYARSLKLLEASIAIDGHHKGLPDNSLWKSDTEPYKRAEVPDFDKIVSLFQKDIDLEVSKIQLVEPLRFENTFQREIYVRYLFSTLTDSDWLSTEAHFDSGKTELRYFKYLSIEEMTAKLEEEFSNKSTSGPINILRNTARYQALSKAMLPPGFYSLALPTGMGKTLTSMAWALRHAKTNSLKRIIIVLPYISIIDQTAQELKKIFGEECVLEHHSSYNEEQKNSEDKDGNLAPEQKRKQLACENWDYPIIVTTTVQFFESLFSNKPSKCRKNHNISKAIVIFDEVQSIPKEIILPTLQMLSDVQAIMKTSFLFCTATQPAFAKRPNFEGITSIVPLIENPGILYDSTRRVKYEFLDMLAPIDNERLSELVVDCNDSTLVIFNTKKAALEFFITMKNYKNWEDIYHLSTAMCPCHRKEVIRKVRENLAQERKILVVSTQLIEAGVDFDFPVLFRAMAPLESVIQSAGRCNREGKMRNDYGRVFLFKLLDGGMPNKTYAACAGFAEELIKTDLNQLYKHDVFEKYYANVVDLYIDQKKQQGINDARKSFNFQTVNDSYHFIDDASEGLFIYNYNDESRKLLHSLQHKEFLSRSDYRMMQSFTVQVYDHFISNNIDFIETMVQGFKVWHGNYDHATGVSITPKEVDNYVV